MAPSVVVDFNTILNPSAARIGVNANYWEDAPARRAPGSRPAVSGYKRLRAKFIRWPGGHKADGVTWFLDADGNPVTTPTPRLCRFGDGEWPATDPGYWTPVNDRSGSFSREVYGLQEFLDDCATVDAEPVIVVALDTIHNPPRGSTGWTLSKAQAIANAVEMVRWCNVTHDYGVKYWELGNESWSDSTGYTAGYINDPAAYGRDFAEMAAAMKAIDPTIMVGLNGNTQAWFASALAGAGPGVVDFLSAHRYPLYGLTYAQYQATALNSVSEANRATNALATITEPDRSWIKVLMTETGYTTQPNTMGAAVIIAHILGAQLATANILATLVWNTRYAPYGSSHDALDNLNGLTVAGQGQALAGLLAPGAMVAASSTVRDVFAFASRAAGRAAVLLINRADVAQTVTVGIGATAGCCWQLAGKGSTDPDPTLTRSPVTLTGGSTPPLTLPAASVTVLELGGLT
jgi:alpha-N-arabinofuranosidase